MWSHPSWSFNSTMFLSIAHTYLAWAKHTWRELRVVACHSCKTANWSNKPVHKLQPSRIPLLAQYTVGITSWHIILWSSAHQQDVVKDQRAKCQPQWTLKALLPLEPMSKGQTSKVWVRTCVTIMVPRRSMAWLLLILQTDYELFYHGLHNSIECDVTSEEDLWFAVDHFFVSTAKRSKATHSYVP